MIVGVASFVIVSAVDPEFVSSARSALSPLTLTSFVSSLYCESIRPLSILSFRSKGVCGICASLNAALIFKKLLFILWKSALMSSVDSTTDAPSAPAAVSKSSIFTSLPYLLIILVIPSLLFTTSS